jgi:hypothetical protein
MRISLILLVIAAYPSLGQNILIKVTGETEPYKKLKFHDEYVEITKEKEKAKIKINERDVAAYYDNDFQTIYYKKPIVPDLEVEFEIFPDKRDKRKFDYLERTVVGAVNLYIRIESSGSPGTVGASGVMTGGTNTTTTYYYAEKGDVYKNVFVSGLLPNREKRVESLKPFVADDPEMLKKLESEDFRLNEKNLLRLIQEYNLRNFQKVPVAEYKTVSHASFYTRVRQKIKEKLTISVNDSLQMKLPVTGIPLPIALPNKVPSKVCVAWEGGSYCTTIAPCPFAVQYYEFDYFVSDKSFEIRKRTLNEFKNYMVSVLK